MEDPESADAKIMPQSAIRIAGADHILELMDIGQFLVKVNHEN